jgi:hypothetical protein
MPERANEMNKKIWTVVGVVIAVIFLGTLVYGSMSVTQTECELCVEFRGLRQCRRGAGVDEVEARRAAVRSACAVMSNGMDESIACNNVVPREVACGGS